MDIVRIIERPDNTTEAGRYHNRYLAGLTGNALNRVNGEVQISLHSAVLTNPVYVPAEYVVPVGTAVALDSSAA